MSRTLLLAAAFGLLSTPALAQEWTPLGSESFGTELTSRWIPVPNGESGAPRQGWLGTADGFFPREVHLAYDYVDGGDSFDSHRILGRFHLPLSRRLWIGTEVPFYQTLNGDGDFGDITVTGQVMLHESRNVSLNFGNAFRIPTGSSAQGNDVFAWQPQLNLWTDIGKGFSLRGRVAWEFPDSGVSDAFIANVSLGQTTTEHGETPFGDFTWYVAGNLRAPTDGDTFVSITPGLRTHVGGNLFLLTGVELPLTRRRDSFSQRWVVQLVKGF